MTTLDLEQTLRRMELLHRLTLASRAGRPWRPHLDGRSRWLHRLAQRPAAHAGPGRPLA